MMLNDMLNTHDRNLIENNLNKFALRMISSFKENIQIRFEN